MKRTTLAKKLTNSTFSDTTIPYNTFVDEGKRLIAVANSFFTQWSGRQVSMWSKNLLLYNLDTFELINYIDDLNYEVNDLSFHPIEPIIAIAIGSYDGGAYYEGELLIWNYNTSDLNSILKENREVTKCSFYEKGEKIKFTVNPPDDLDCPDYSDKDYLIDFPSTRKISLNDLSPIFTAEHIDNFEIENYNNRLSNSEEKLIELSKTKNKPFVNRHLIWDIKFISENEIAIARNNATVEIWNITNETCKEIKLDEVGECVEFFLNTFNNTILVNLWSRDFISEHTNKLFSINLNTYEFKELISCHHTISKTKNNYFLARQTDHSDKTKKDFILDPLYNVIFENRFGHYDLFNHYIRIDDTDLLYYLVGNPKEQHQNKTLYSIDPITLKATEILQLEKQPNHYNNLNGILVDNDLIISGNVYSSNRNTYDTQELFCMDLITKKEKWMRTTEGQVCAFDILDKGTTIIMALTSGQLELIDTINGKTVELIHREINRSFDRPLSIATFENKIVVGLTNGEIEIYNRKKNGI